MAIDTRNNTAYGVSQPMIGVPGGPILARRAPTAADRAPIGTTWIDQDTDGLYIITSVVRNAAHWIGFGGGVGIFDSIITTTAGGIEAQLGNIVADVGNITATLGNIRAVAGNLQAGTTVTAGTGITATTGDITATLNDIVATAGDIYATAGDIYATAGDVYAVAGDIIATAGNIQANAGSLSAFTTVTAGTGVTSTTGDITATIGNVNAHANLTTTDGSVIIGSAQANAASNSLSQRKIRVAGAVLVGDELGNILFEGYDGAAYQVGSKITSVSTDAVGAGLIPANLRFWTKPNGAGVLASRFEITSAGNITVNAPDAGVGLTVAGGGATVAVGDISVTLGNVTAAAGNLSATLGSVSAGTTVTAGTNLLTTNGDVIIGSNAAAVASNSIIQRKIRAAAAVQVGDELGNVLFEGYDGAAYQVGSKITSVSTDAVGAGLIPANLHFWTKPNGAGVLASRLEINSAGNVTVNAPDAGTALTIAAGGITATAGNITATLGDIVATHGDVTINTATHGVTLPGPIRIITGAGAPAGALALNVGDIYIRTDPGNANERMYIATVVATTWANVTCSA